MDPVTIGIIGVAVLVVIFLLGMPVGFTMAFVGVIGFCVVKGPRPGWAYWRVTSGRSGPATT